VFIIGIDPHKGSHTAAVIDSDEQVVGEFSLRADCRQRDRLLRFARSFTPRVWAVEGATGTGRRPCRRGCGCWTQAARTRTTPTMLVRLRSLHCGTATSPR